MEKNYLEVWNKLHKEKYEDLWEITKTILGELDGETYLKYSNEISEHLSRCEARRAVEFDLLEERNPDDEFELRQGIEEEQQD